ncbi:PKD domain-containing protein [Candidatus Peregrinibacteria bacterium]|nr:PKD domain-containing protein [Candidatus Peregrinibacteria bacterium]
MDELNIKTLGSENPDPKVPSVTPETPVVPATPAASTAPTAFSLDSIGSSNQQQTSAPSTAAPASSETEKVQLTSGDASLNGSEMTAAGTTDVVAPKKSFLKTGLIIAGSVVAVGAVVAAVFFGQNGWPFKGELTAVNEATRFVALTLCPDDQYMPKQTDTALKLVESAFVPANAQSAINTELSDVRILDKATSINLQDASRLLNEVNTVDTTADTLNTEFQASNELVPLQYDINQYQATMELAPSLQYNLNNQYQATMQVAPEYEVTCKDIPHDNLIPGERECEAIDLLYADPTGYLLNDVTKQHLEEWYQMCHPKTEVQCGVNEDYSKETNECVCKEGYFDIGAEVADMEKTDTLATTDEVVAETFSYAEITDKMMLEAPLEGTRLLYTDSINTRSRCMNCDDINGYLEKYQTQLATETDETMKVALQARIDRLNQIAEKYGCKKPTVKCAEDQVLTSDGVCECPAYSYLDESTQKCTFDCKKIVNSIISLRDSPTKTPETEKQLNEFMDLAAKNQCEIPEEKTICQTYEEDAQKALSEKNYDAYISISMKLLSADCGREVNSCQRTLAEGSLVKRVQDMVQGNTELEEKYKARMEELRGEYYSNEECRDDNRCTEIEATRTKEDTTVTMLDETNAETFRITEYANMELAPLNLEYSEVYLTDRINYELTPSEVFEDDKEYYDKYCQKPELTCEELLKRYNLDSSTPQNSSLVTTLDVSPEVQDQLNRCLTPTREFIPENPTLTCEPSTRNATTGQVVTWTATVDGVLDKNSVTYEWSEDAIGTGESVTATYNTEGEKNVLVVASIAGDPSLRATCSTNVTPISPVQPPPPTAPVPGPTPAPAPAPTPPPTAPAIAPPTPPSPVSSPTPTPPPASAAIPAVTPPTPPPTAPAIAPPSPSSPIASPTPSPSTPVSLPITTPSAPVIATTTKPVAVTPVAPGAPVVHSSAPEVIPPVVVPEKEVPPTITPTGPEVYIYLIGLAVGQLYFFRRKVFGSVKNK